MLQVKGNHPGLRAAIQAAHARGGGQGHTQGTGAVRWRTTTYACAEAPLQAAWAGLARYVVVEKWTTADPGRVHVRYFITSLAHGSAADLAAGIRGHWGIENKLHRARTVHFGLGRTRIRHPQASVTLALLITLALNLLLHQGATSLVEAQAQFVAKLPQQLPQLIRT